MHAYGRELKELSGAAAEQQSCKMAESGEAALLADLAQLKLEQGDTVGAQELFRKALETRQQAGDTGTTAAEAAAEDADSWEAWEETSAHIPQPGAAAQPPATADSWESAAAQAPPRRAAPLDSPSTHAGAAPTTNGGGGGDGDTTEAELQFGGGHVLEFYDLTPAVRATHLESFLERFCSSHLAPPTLKWVDDCHAAVVCCDPKAARQLLAAATVPSAAPEFKLRGYADAGSGTRKLPASELLPPKPRPRTSAAVARRLIGGALNMRLRDRDAEQQLTAERRQLRQEREQRQKALDATWDG